MPWIEFGRGADQFHAIVPRRGVVGVDSQTALDFFFSREQMTRVGQERAVNEGQFHVILADADLRDPRADDSASPLVEVTQPAPADRFRRVGRGFRNSNTISCKCAGVCWRKASISWSGSMVCLY